MKVAVFFDVDDTLLDNYQAFKQTLTQLYSIDQINEEELRQLYLTFRTDSENIYARFQFSSKNDAEYVRWQRIAQRFGKPDTLDHLQQADEIYHDYQYQRQLSQDFIELFQFLDKQQVQVGVLTNGFQAAQQRKLDQLQLDNYIDPNWLLISESFGVAKPEIACFEKLRSLLPNSVEQFIYLGDSYRNDIYPSLAAGWQPIWLNRFREKQMLEGMIEVTNKKEAIETIKKIIFTE